MVIINREAIFPFKIDVVNIVLWWYEFPCWNIPTTIELAIERNLKLDKYHYYNRFIHYIWAAAYSSHGVVLRSSSDGISEMDSVPISAWQIHPTSFKRELYMGTASYHLVAPMDFLVCSTKKKSMCEKLLITCI